MPKDIDESLIEATIRRVAEARAALADGVDAEAESEATVEDVTPDGDAASEPRALRRPQVADESVIEATIRRVAEARAAREDGVDAEPKQDATVEDVTREEDAAGESRTSGRPQPADESVIESTIRRIGAAKAASSAQMSEDEPVSKNGAGLKRPVADESQIEATIRRVAKAKSANDAESGSATNEHGDEAEPPPDRADAWFRVTERIEARLTEIEESVLSLARRIDTMEPLLEGRGAPARPVAPAGGYRGHPAAADDDDEWDEQPRAASMAVGMPPRPAIFRDPAPATARAEIEDDESFAEPDEPPAAPIAAERRGLDLLPRTYRITVEDKRRGVDLVPLHRVLLALEGVRDMSLLSYNNGIAIVSLEVVTEIDLDVLQQSVSRAMAREAKVELHNENTIVIKLAEE